MKNNAWSGISTGISVRNDEWQHVAITRATGTNVVNFYFNGQLAYSGTADGVGTGQIDASSYPLQIGSRSTTVGSGFSSYFNGQIDEVRLYNTVRTASQIQSDMHNYGPITTVGLVLYLDFNEGTSATYTNRSTDSSKSGDLTAYGTNGTSLVATTTSVSGESVTTFTRDYLTSFGGWKAPVGITNPRALVVGGGGGGGSAMYGFSAGGGGGAQVVEVSVSVSDNSYYPIRIGTGGLGALVASSSGAIGDTSTAFSQSAQGGGGGASGIADAGGTTGIASAGYTGGGGGANWTDSLSIRTGAGTSPRKGGTARFDSGYADGQAGGGGAGAGGNGGDITSTGSGASIVTTPGTGGAGISSQLQTGSTITYGGGGGGGKRQGTTLIGSGADGGGNGGFSAAGSDGLANRGGGGGGAGSTDANYTTLRMGGKGGSGVVIVRYGFNFTTSTNLTLAAGDLIYRTAKLLTVVVTKPGKVDLKANGKFIPGCRSLAATAGNSYTVTCNFKPSLHGAITISALFTPSDGTYSSSKSVTSPVLSGKRTNNR